MNYTERVNVGKRPVCLVGVQLNEEVWDRLLHLIVVFEYPVDSFGDVVHDNVQIYFIWL